MTARFPLVSAPVPTDQEPRDGSAGTLGELLYADKSKDRVSEEKWVELVRTIAASNPYALRSLYDRTRRPVFTLIMRIIRNRATAEELTLDVFHDVWRRASGYDPKGGSVLGWIMNQARSRAIDRWRFDQRKKRAAPAQDEPLPIALVADFEEVLALREQGQLVRSALEALAPEEREAIEIAYFSELTYAEAAARLNQPLGTIKSRIRSGLGKLRIALQPKVDHS
jgi:RNA polymerase sigma-70 factor (ECF subfamily)